MVCAVQYPPQFQPIAPQDLPSQDMFPVQPPSVLQADRSRTTPIREEMEGEGSVVSEGTPVPGGYSFIAYVLHRGLARTNTIHVLCLQSTLIYLTVYLTLLLAFSFKVSTV